MCELLGLTSSAPVTTNLSLPTLASHGASTGAYPDGWGVGFYEGQDVRLLKEATGPAESDWIQFVANQNLRSRLVIAHTRHATRGTRSYANAQPFVRELGGRAHLFAHNGDVPGVFDPGAFGTGRFTPIGETDSERAFCILLDRLASSWTDRDNPPTLRARFQIVSSLATQLRALGPANFLYSDGDFLFAHAHRRKQSHTGRVEPPGLVLLERQCHEGEQSVAGKGIAIAGIEQFIALIASVPLTSELWEPLGEGELVVASGGRIAARHLPHESAFRIEPSFEPVPTS